MNFPWENKEIDYSKLVELPMNYEHDKLGYGQENPGQFRKELLDNNIFTTFDAIKFGFRTATSRVDKFKKGSYVLFTKKDTQEKLLCKIITDSYPVKDIDPEEWSRLEGWTKDHLKLNPNTLNKNQFIFKYIKSI